MSHPVFAATRLLDEGTSQGFINELNCVGAGISCSKSGIRGTATVAGGGGSGDVTDVGPGCSTGACLTDGLATTGGTLAVWEGTTVDTNQITFAVPADPAGARTITFQDATTTLVGRDTTDTLTNKTISFTSNTITASSAELATAISNETGSGLAVFGTAPTFLTSLSIDTGGFLDLDDQGELRFYETDANGENFLAFKAPAAITTTSTCTLENDSNPIPDSCVGDGTDSGASPTTWDVIGDAAGAGDVLMAETVQSLSWDSAATAAAYDALTVQLTHDSTTDSSTQRGLVVERLASTGTAAWETLVQIQNNDTDGAVTTGLEILSAAGAITTAIDASDAEIGTALAIGSNDLTTGATTISSAELDRLDGLTNTIVTDNTATTSIDGEGLTIASGTLNADGFILATGNTAGFTASFYCIPSGGCSTGSGSDDAWTSPMGGTIKNFYMFTKGAPGVGNSWSCAPVINNAASTNLTITYSGTEQGEKSDTTGSDAIAAGDELGFNCIESGTAASTAQVGFAVVFVGS